MAQEIVIPKGSFQRALGILALLFFGVGLLSSIYRIEAEEVGVVLRFGRHTGVNAEPGLRLKIPFGVDRVIKLPVKRQLKEEFGFETIKAGVKTKYRTSSQDRRLLATSLMVTGDLNASVVEWIVQYRIETPEDFLFNIRNPIGQLRDATEAVMREVIGDRTVDEVLTVGRHEIEVEATRKLQALMDQYQTGMSIEQLVLQDVNPPDAVKASFNAVNEAQQERNRIVNEARANYNQVVPRARGEALQGIQEAEGYALERVNRAEGDIAKFNAVFAEYKKAPKVTRKRIYLETMREVIPKLGRKIVIDEDVKQVLPLLQLSTEGSSR